MSPVPRPPSRRRFLGLAGTAVGLAGCTSSGPDDRPSAGAPTTPTSTTPTTTTPTTAATSSASTRVAATGARQAGVDRPHPPQPALLAIVFDLVGRPATVLEALGSTVAALTAGTAPRLAGLEPGDLTATVGVGPRLVAAVDRTLPGAGTLPAFPSDRLDAARSGGDVIVQLCASDPLVLPAAAAALATVGGLRERWRQTAFRGPNVAIDEKNSAPRNLLGFVDGIIGPRSAAELDADVWLPASSRFANATIMVARRMELDLDRFLDLSPAAQERVIGRRRADAAPLSGGSIATDPDLGAKTPSGAYRIPADAHLRRANPSSTGVPPMLRRSYSFADDQAAGLLFVSFQNALRTFVATMNRMSSADALLGYARTTRSGTFLVLPGVASGGRLGAQLYP